MSKKHSLAIQIFSALAVMGILAGSIWFIQYNVSHKFSLEGRVSQATERIVQSAYLSCQSADEQLHRETESLLHRINPILARVGPARLLSTVESWKTTHPFSDEILTLDLPRMEFAKPEPMSPQSEPFPLSQISRETGGLSELFQRVDEKGNLLLVASSSPGKLQTPALLPATDPEGDPVPLVRRLLQKEIVQFPELIDGTLYWCVYVPLVGEGTGRLAGVLRIRLKEPVLDKTRREIIDLKVGKTGYAYVLKGTGRDRGSYIISRQGARDGENLWNSIDAAGRPFIQKIIRKARALAQENNYVSVPSASDRYPWINPGETTPRTKWVSVVYFEPWDWVIGAGYYEDDF